jgi:choline dehydrogenase-like flavoprotein
MTVTSPTPQYTDFSRDVLGRYVCNGLDEALASTTRRAQAKPFDIIVVGGGSFGSALAQHVLYLDRFRNHRILVLEAGPFLLPEHVQNLPTLGLFPPGPTMADPGVPRNEVWGLPWRSSVQDGFPGLAYCVGGRSVFWGGWSPQLLDTPNGTEMSRDRWPGSLIDDLNGRYFAESAEQIGVRETNDFVFGEMHRALRKRLFEGIQSGAVTDAVPLAELPLAIRHRRGATAEEKEQLKLEAPLAVQGRAPRSGFFPINKFSAVPLLMRAARQAWMESGGDDVQRRLMVVPNCHVIRLETSISDGVGAINAVHTSLGVLPVPDRGVVVLAAGTIESTRLALLSFGGALGYELIGTNLMAHSRSNYTIRIPRNLLPVPHTGDLEASALFVKGRAKHQDGSVSHFHLQITAAGLKGIGTNSEAELFQKIPDIDTIDQFRTADEDNVVMTIRGVGELQPGNPDNRITLGQEVDEFGVPRAFVEMGNPRPTQPQPGESQQSANDRETWATMDHASDQVRDVFAGPGGAQDLQRQRDGLGTTHHESGTLRVGEDPATSVTTPQGRFHYVVNAYAAGPAVLPTMGSPNPMLSGIALARRLAFHLVAPLPPPALEPGFQWLFDGTLGSFQKWRQAGPGSFEFVDAESVLVANPGDDIGLLYYAPEGFGDFVLRLQFRIDSRDDNSGVFVRSRDPGRPWPDIPDPRAATNPAWVAVHTGFELQIDDGARPDGSDMHRTGAVYAVEVGQEDGKQAYHRGSALQPGEWNDYEIEVRGNAYTARLNHCRTTSFVNLDPGRGVSASTDPSSGFVGLQIHIGRVAFRAIRIEPLT